MKLIITLSLFAITMFINNVYANNNEASLCNKALENGDVAVALAEASKVLTSNKNDKDALICQGRALANKDDFNSALASFKLADANSTDAFDKTISTLLIGNTYKALKQYDLAISSYQQTTINAKAAKSVAFERVSYNAIGSVYAETKQFESALKAYLQGSKLAANDNERGDSYEKVAKTYHQMNQHDLALEYQIKAYVMHAAVGTLDQFAHTSIELGRYYMLSKNYVSAENTLNKILKLAKEQGGAYYEAQASYLLAKVKVAMGDIPSAKTLILNAKSIARNVNDKELDEEIDQETKGLF